MRHAAQAASSRASARRARGRPSCGPNSSQAAISPGRIACTQISGISIGSRAARFWIGEPEREQRHDDADRRHRPQHAAMPAERAAEHRGQRHHGEGDGGERRGQPAMRLDRELADVARAHQARIGVQQLGDRHLGGVAEALLVRLALG